MDYRHRVQKLGITASKGGGFYWREEAFLSVVIPLGEAPSHCSVSL